MGAPAAGSAPEATTISPPLFLLLFLCLSCSLKDLRSTAQTLPQQEVDALKQIKAMLKVKVGWDFSLNPCGGNSEWVNFTTQTVTSNLTCDCNTTPNVCHVISIQLKSQNLTGVLPDEFANLTSLRVIDLSLNYINGTIPSAWASLPLTNVSLLGNRISGPIPKELGNITTLQTLVLEDNELEGPLPPALGMLTSLDRLLLSANNFKGELPDAFGNLKNLTDFRIDGNNISGKIPSFIGNWAKLSRLDMQGTSMEGPFPSIFSTLGGITELRVSDWKGSDGSFPPLENMKSMIYLVLRNCSISGKIPDYIGKMTNLRLLDLSFNNLTGEIPSNFKDLPLNYMYLTNNMLSGSIPTWISSSNQHLDVSFNTFSGTPIAGDCQQGNVNLVATYGSSESNSIAVCFKKNIPCSGKAKNYNLFINCGGKEVTVNENVYEEDSSPQGTSTFYTSESRSWAYSSTGSFVGNDNAKYVASNASLLNMTNPELYTSARLSPSSLKYYGLCLQRGNYTVKLHFAEIMFTDDQTYSSVGKRLFDVSIQGDKVLKDFNIAEVANGTSREIIKPFNTLVEGSTLEIHFQWAGKGTNAIPERGVYGPLISAISVTPNFEPDLGESKLSLGAILGIVAASSVLLLLILFFLWFCLRRKNLKHNEFEGIELQTGYFSLKQIKAATMNFDPQNKIGEGGFGPVYKGVLPDGGVIAVKQLSSKSKQGNREFVNEIGMISALQHPNLVKLYGCCIEGNQLLLIYEYMENNSLARALFGRERTRLKLDWQTRCKICLGIARGLAYLHEESRLKIVHRDIKATNVLLDKDLNSKISDFGLAKLDEEENTHISTRIAGTIGYMAPEYAMRGYLTDKADVYSFGVVTLEIVSGMSNTNYRPKEEFVYLLDWAYVLQEQGSLLELVDPNLGSNYSKREALQMLNLSLLCTSPSPTLRPTMTTVVSMLEGRTPVHIPSVKRTRSNSEELRFKSFEKLSHDGQTQSISMDAPDAPLGDSSASTHSSKECTIPLTSSSKFQSGSTE